MARKPCTKCKGVKTYQEPDTGVLRQCECVPRDKILDHMTSRYEDKNLQWLPDSEYLLSGLHGALRRSGLWMVELKSRNLTPFYAVFWRAMIEDCAKCLAEGRKFLSFSEIDFGEIIGISFSAELDDIGKRRRLLYPDILIVTVATWPNIEQRYSEAEAWIRLRTQQGKVTWMVAPQFRSLPDAATLGFKILLKETADAKRATEITAPSQKGLKQLAQKSGTNLILGRGESSIDNAHAQVPKQLQSRVADVRKHAIKHDSHGRHGQPSDQ